MKVEFANPVTAIDIALEPDATMVQRAMTANARLFKSFPKGFTLDETHNPHVTILQQFVRTDDLDKVFAAANAVLAKEKPTAWTLKAFKYYYIPSPPVGLAGIFVAAVLAAAMSAVAGELNSLATVTVIDFYRRWIRPEAPDAHYLLVSKAATGFWGLFACVVATFAATLGSLIVVVNRFGSFFYGSILGVFLLAMIPRARATGAFLGLIAGMTAVGVVNFGAPSVSWLWHNVIGAATAVAVGLILSARGIAPRSSNAE